MLDRVRQLLNTKPWIGWAVAGAFLAMSVVILIRSQTAGRDEYHPDRLQETVTIRFTDTGDEISTTRGRLLRDLTTGQGQLDPSKGLINPKTGQPTGFLFDKDEWNAMVARINQEKADRKGISAFGGSKSPSAPAEPK